MKILDDSLKMYMNKSSYQFEDFIYPIESMENIRTIIDAIETRDIYSRGHSDRVSELSMLIGKKLCLSDDDLKLLKLGGLFHDIGKIGISGNILLKNSKLTDDEYSEVKNHPLIGEYILSRINKFKGTIPIVKYHHERYDGNRVSSEIKR